MKEHNKYYWDGRDSRKSHAEQHTKEMARKYSAEIQDCIKNTKYYKGDFVVANDSAVGNLKMEVSRDDSVSAIMKYADVNKKTAVLNFASYKHPGGGFMSGSRAQEECLCHESFLYNVLKEFESSYYEVNRKDLNKALYRDVALYSPDVIFEKDDRWIKCDVITCASPNFSTASYHVDRETNNIVMRDRIRFILNIAKKEKVDTLILGAWGCGVFQQDPVFVADCFVKEAANILSDTNIHIIFAVIPALPRQADNLSPFVGAVNNWKNTK